MLAIWYDIIRHSVDVKIMCRFPKKVLLVQALILQEDYYASCIRNRIEPDIVQINGDWINGFLDEYRISQREPNRKFKAPRPILCERLKIFWIVFFENLFFELHHYFYVYKIQLNCLHLQYTFLFCQIQVIGVLIYYYLLHYPLNLYFHYIFL